MEDCIFCKIINQEIPSTKVYEDDLVYAFKDADPQAPVHFLVVPKVHIPSANDLKEEDQALLGHILLVISRLAKDLGIAEAGYRIVNNCGEDGGQTVGHLHYHILGGRSLQWPPG
ncbi:MAG: histidine triad nucleotide-binding protein [Tissierellia bacterium]|nr:histidine triad nucleotide-binding protein [Tissierellia bacterium]